MIYERPNSLGDLKLSRSVSQTPNNENAQEGLFRQRISTPLPYNGTGRHVRQMGLTHDGVMFYCKDDTPPYPVRAAECLSYQLAAHVGIAVPDFAILENPSGDTFFGSADLVRNAQPLEVQSILRTPQLNELGARADWPGQYFSRLNAFDMFIKNYDRHSSNFVVTYEGGKLRLCAIDFGSADYKALITDSFPDATSRTAQLSEITRRVHGEHIAAGFALLDELRDTPRRVIDRFLNVCPADWIEGGFAEAVSAAWGGPEFNDRIIALRKRLKDAGDV